ncbi:MAG TPA: FmdB family zinc ribbon protein [Thermodesulfovibrionales bacterium]|nr:FmdB family zinc ribbon protein [Thermodesulfovibrionales bacterium]
MPIYEYKCEKCRKHHEIMQKITERPLTICPSCGGAMKKLISNTSFVLKGSGWYRTDYAGKDKKETKETAGKKEKADSTPKKESKKEPRSEKKSSAETTK